MTPRGLLYLVAGPLLLVGGFLLGAARRPVRPAGATVVRVDRMPPLPAAAWSHDGISAFEVRAIVRDELARAAPAATEAAAADTEAEAPPAPPADDEVAGQEAMALVERAVAAGRWTAADRDALRALMPRLDRAQSDAVLRALATAINAQQLRVEAADGPF